MNAALDHAHLAITAAMTGICWFVQIVHYPLFHLTGPEYYRHHARLTGFVVAPIMLAELGLALALLARKPSSLTWTGLALLGVIWLSTFLLQVPLHERIQKRFSPVDHQRLVTTNWIRTAAWTVRTVLACLIL